MNSTTATQHWKCGAATTSEAIMNRTSVPSRIRNGRRPNSLAGAVRFAPEGVAGGVEDHRYPRGEAEHHDDRDDYDCHVRSGHGNHLLGVRRPPCAAEGGTAPGSSLGRPALHRESPEVILAVEVTNSAKVLARVAEHHADAGFVEGHHARRKQMKTVPVRTDHLVVVVDPAHSWARLQSPLTGSDLAAAELIVREPGSGTREVLEDTLAGFGGLRYRLELGSTAAILAAARRGEGPAVLSALAVADDLDAGRLVAVPIEGINLTRSLRAVWPSDRPLPPLARRLLNIAAA